MTCMGCGSDIARSLYLRERVQMGWVQLEVLVCTPCGIRLMDEVGETGELPDLERFSPWAQGVFDQARDQYA